MKKRILNHSRPTLIKQYPFSNRSRHVCTDENDSKTIRVDAYLFKNGKNKIPFSNENGYVWTGPPSEKNTILWPNVYCFGSHKGHGNADCPELPCLRAGQRPCEVLPVLTKFVPVQTSCSHLFCDCFHLK